MTFNLSGVNSLPGFVFVKTGISFHTDAANKYDVRCTLQHEDALFTLFSFVSLLYTKEVTKILKE